MTLVAAYTLAVVASLSLGYWAGTKARSPSDVLTTLEAGIEKSVEEVRNGRQDSGTDKNQAAVALGEGNNYKLVSGIAYFFSLNLYCL